MHAANVSAGGKTDERVTKRIVPMDYRNASDIIKAITVNTRHVKPTNDWALQMPQCYVIDDDDGDDDDDSIIVDSDNKEGDAAPQTKGSPVRGRPFSLCEISLFIPEIFPSRN